MASDLHDSTPEAEEPSSSDAPAASLPFCVVGIGASAGGLEAFMEMMGAIPANTGMAYVLVLHLPPEHESMLPQILGRVSHMPVVEARDGASIKCDCAYVLPAGSDAELREGRLVLTPRDAGPGRYRPIDHFLRSIATAQGHKAVGVILSGTGSDGTLGIQEIKAVGGLTFAQDDTANQKSMPQSAIATGAVDFVLAPGEIAAELARIARHPFVASAAEPEPGESFEFDLEPVLAILRERVGVDFAAYKPTTLYRRIARRIVLHRLDGVAEYTNLLDSSQTEADALYRDILINVTSFFRNPGAFEALKAEVFPSLAANRSRHDPLRVWTLGCSTGEEAYSVAMAYAEFAESSACAVPMQLFGTDLNAAAIDKARAGLYSRAAAPDVGTERLQRFFVETDGSVRIAKSIRDMCVFAQHNVLTDPPFSRMDLVSCRNLLIYLGAEMQRKVIPTVHYGLRDHGYLWLGTSETVGAHRGLFELKNARYKIYAKIPIGERAAPPRPAVNRPAAFVDRITARAPETQAPEAAFTDADRLLVARFAPPGLLVREDLEIVQYRGNTTPYLAVSPGKASLNLLRMLREELTLGVRAAFERAKREETPTRQIGLRYGADGAEKVVDVEVVPVKTGPGRAQHFLVLFEESSPLRESPPRGPATPSDKSPDEQEIARLKHELVATREYLQSVIEQQDAANEQLQSASEEVQSANEELQSINEELETSKEEVQSSNEELATVNDELHARNSELALSNSDLINLLSSVQTAIVMLAPGMRIRRYTPVAGKMLNLIPSDIGRPLTDIKLNIDLPELEKLVAEVTETMAPHERELEDRQGRWFLLRVWPYRTVDNRIDGTVVILVDVDTLKRSQQVLFERTELLNKVHEPIIMWEPGGTITYWNNAAEETYGFTRDQAIGRKEHELLMTSPPLGSFSQELFADGEWHGELIHTRRDGQKIIIDSRMVVVMEPDGRRLVVEANRPVSARKETDLTLRRFADDLVTADRHKDEFLAMLAHELRNPLAPLRNVVAFLRASATREEDRQRALDIMDRQIGSMARLIDDLLDVSRITLSQIELRAERVELGTAMRRVAEQNASYFDLRQQSLQFRLPSAALYVDADPVRLEQITGNLLNNASKYTPTGGEIVLSLGEGVAENVQRGAGREAVISVRDNGIGIAPDKLPHVFDLFMRATRSIDQTYGGLGVGLTLVRRLTELHGGAVEARSAGLGQGSEFIVRLPAAPLPATEPVTATQPQIKSPKRRILVVDDNADIVESMAMTLRLADHEVEVAESGERALETAVRFDPDVIFMDIGMPDMDGYELARRLRAEPIKTRATLVALSGFGHTEAMERARAAGLTDYLVKPASAEHIEGVLARLR